MLCCFAASAGGRDPVRDLAIIVIRLLLGPIVVGPQTKSVHQLYIHFFELSRELPAPA